MTSLEKKISTLNNEDYFLLEKIVDRLNQLFHQNTADMSLNAYATMSIE